MAVQGRILRVSSLPADIDDDKLTDKLLIHFLRPRHGGGEIASVKIVKANPVSALITFEDSGVAWRVLEHSPHFLRVDSKTYKLVVAEHRSSLEPDKVILSMSVIVDYNQLPLGRTAMTRLHETYPDIQMDCSTQEELCTLRGPYSLVQAALAQMLELPGDAASAEGTAAVAADGRNSGAAHTVEGSHTLGSPDQRRTPGDPSEEASKKTSRHTTNGTAEDRRVSSRRGDSSAGGGYACEDADQGQVEGGAVDLQMPGDPTAFEDFSLIMDADLFQYIQAHCGKEYRHILGHHSVEAVDVTAQGLTTLFLQCKAGVGRGGQERERLSSARGKLSQLYQQNEKLICRSLLPKSILTLRGGLERAIEYLNVKLPKLLLNEDEQNIYIIGNSSDVSDAKQFLLLDNGEPKRLKEDVASLLRYPTYNSSTPKLAKEERETPTFPSIAGSLNGRIDKMKDGQDGDGKQEDGARKYKLAARFKDIGLGGLGLRPGDFTAAGLLLPNTQTDLGPMLGRNVLPETGSTGVGLKANSTEGDILFKNEDAHISSNPLLSKPSPMSTHVGTQQMFTSPPLSATPKALSGSTTVLPTSTGTTLKRASSFSGPSRPKAEAIRHTDVQGDTGNRSTTLRGRSSSFRTDGDRREIFSVEITVSPLMWKYIKKVYSPRLKDLTTDVQMKEVHSEHSHDQTIRLTGLDSSSVSGCQLGLQKLVDMVKEDFSVQALLLSELNVANPEDETLEMCCAEVRSRFMKVIIDIYKDRIYIQGPNMLCFQVGLALKEVFSGASAQIPVKTIPVNQSIPTQANSAQITHMYDGSDPQQKPYYQRAAGDGSGQERRPSPKSGSAEQQTSSMDGIIGGHVGHPLTRRDPVIMEKVKSAGILQADGQDTGREHLSDAGPTTLVAGGDDAGVPRKERRVQSKVAQAEKREYGGPESEVISGPPVSGAAISGAAISGAAILRHSPGRSSYRGLEGICVCGRTGDSVQMAECGVTLCSECMAKIHVHCRVCPKTEPLPKGIRGTMNFSELNISLEGYHRDSTLKITYSIPNGIQGDDHPSPGLPFRGGEFVAYLPHCQKTKKLMPRLQEAFKSGLTFTVSDKGSDPMVTWDGIPHKTKMQGGRAQNGYPDASYLTRLSEVLTAHGIPEIPAKTRK